MREVEKSMQMLWEERVEELNRKRESREQKEAVRAEKRNREKMTDEIWTRFRVLDNKRKSD